MATIVVLTSRNEYSVNLTDGFVSWSHKVFRSPKRAVDYVAQLQELGHKTSKITEDGFRALLEDTKTGKE